MSDGPLVTIAQFDNSFDAELAKLAMENEGITSYIFGDTVNIIQPYMQNAIVLQVSQDDAQRALDLLSEIQNLPEEPDEEDDEQP